MLNVPLLDAPVLAATVNVTVPLPRPLATWVTVIKAVLALAAVHGHVLPTVTVSVNVPPAADAVTGVGVTLAGHEFGFGDGGVSGMPVNMPAPPREIEYSVRPIVPATGTDPTSDTVTGPVTVTAPHGTGRHHAPLTASVPFPIADRLPGFHSQLLKMADELVNV